MCFTQQAENGLQVSIGKVNSPWDTGTVTWTQVSSGSSYSYGTSTVPAGIDIFKEFDVTQMVNELVRNPSGNNGFALRQSGQDAAAFYTSDYPDIVFRPRLVVTYDDGVDRVASPAFSAANPAFLNSLQLTITCATAGAQIRYTTDNSEPTQSSPLYSGAITVDRTTQVRAKAFASGKTASATSATHCMKAGGVNYSYFRGSASGVPVLDGLTADSTGVAPWISLPYKWATVDYRVKYEGYINIPATGTYRFVYSTFNSGRLLINGQVVIEDAGLGTGADFSTARTLNAGWVPIRVDANRSGSLLTSAMMLGYSRSSTGSLVTPISPSMLSIGPTSVAPRHGQSAIRVDRLRQEQGPEQYSLTGRHIRSTSRSVPGIRISAHPGNGTGAVRPVCIP